MPQKPTERKKPETTTKRKRRYYNNPQDKRVRARREMRGPRKYHVVNISP